MFFDKREDFFSKKLLHTDEKRIPTLFFLISRNEASIFIQTVLEKTDFRTAHSFSIDPEYNRIKGAKFSASGALSLLEKYHIEVE